MSTPPTTPRAELADTASIERTLMAEGFLAEVFVALSGGVFLTGLALRLGAEPLMLSLLSALPMLAQGAQLSSAWCEARVGSRRRFVGGALALGRFLWLVPVALVVLGATSGGARVTAALAIALTSLLCMAAANSWLTWIAEVVPAPEHARVFGRRSAAVAMATLIATPLGALLLDGLEARGHGAAAWGVLGAVAVASGVAAALILRRIPAAAAQATAPGRMREVARDLLRDPRFRRVLGLFALWNVAIGLPAPFWTLYMLTSLRMSFALVTVHTVIALVVRLVTNRLWYRTIEHIGSTRVLIGCGLAIAAIPLFWMSASAERLWPIWLEAIVSGVIWTGFNQAAFIQPLAVMTPAQRSAGLALFNISTGTTHFLASLAGGAILQALGADGRIGFVALFAASSVLRATCALLALRLNEPGITLVGFMVHFVGYGVLRRPSLGRQWLPAEPGPEPPRGES